MVVHLIVLTEIKHTIFLVYRRIKIISRIADGFMIKFLFSDK